MRQALTTITAVAALVVAANCGDSSTPPGEDVGPDAADTRVLTDTVAASGDVDVATGPPDAEDVDDDDAEDADAPGDDAADSDAVAPSGPWRSRLYPEGWAPGDAPEPGRFLHDFSYAGYQNGEAALGDGGPADVIDAAADFGADASGETDATGPLQAAIDAAAAQGGAVIWLPAGDYRVDGTLEVSASRVVLRGDGPANSRLSFTRHAGMSYRSHLTFRGDTTGEVEAALARDAAIFDRTVAVADASALSPGDDVALGWIISPDFVAAHGMADHWRAFNDAWQPFFRRTITAIDTDETPHLVTLDVPLRYPAKVRDQASLRREDGVLTEVGVEGLGFANAVGWADAWAQDQVHAIEFTGVADAWVVDVASFPSPSAPAEGPGAGAHLQSGGIIIRDSKRVTVADATMALPQHRGGGGNGYLFEVRASSEILFRDCDARAGRHNFIQNWGFGATGVVWLRVHSEDGGAMQSRDSTLILGGDSEFHHSLATANLIDASVVDDGWSAINRKDYSTGAGHTATQCVFWNTRGGGRIRSYQFGMGYVVGTGPAIELQATPPPAPDGVSPELWEALGAWTGAAPDDWVEGEGRADDLMPPSLYEDQLARRLGAQR